MNFLVFYYNYVCEDMEDCDWQLEKCNSIMNLWSEVENRKKSKAILITINKVQQSL